MTKKRVPFLQFESPWCFDPGTVRLPLPPDGLSAEEAARRLREGELEQPYIVETSLERRLHFSHCSTQSVMHLDEPDALVSAYTRKMMAFLHVQRIRAAFDGGALLVPVAADDNMLLFAFRRRMPWPTTAKYESRAQRLQARLALEFPRYFRRICQGHVVA
jgi:hypothetical protein